jgi:putative hemolysin
MTPLEWFFFLFFVGCSGFLAASEVALLSLSRFQLRSLKEEAHPGYRKIKNILLDPPGLLITLLLCNEIINIAISAWITKITTEHHPQSLWISHALYSMLFTVPCILLFCEITPKIIGIRVNRIVAILSITPLTWIHQLLTPIRLVLKKLVTFFSQLDAQVFAKPEEPSEILRESDFLLMVEEGYKAGSIQAKELELIKKVFTLDHTSVAEIYTPLSQVLFLPSNTSIQNALTLVQKKRYSRIPVTSINRKEVLGILYSKDLLKVKKNTTDLQSSILTKIRKPLFVYSHLKVNTLFRRFKKYKTHMAIVKNAQEKILGIVTMNDVLDTLFENFLPEEAPKTKNNTDQKAKN